ncbi:hypothetical protein CDAR_602931 [Caerostris darwini]|uniref:Uncharacterized protein n=1 Tax=Caerostris darwini TaxID=1538125 RepID=A0AAV4THB3_9ARAC|nr:hypothetical protein CDAR_602931 [Caerostris darwini]
MASLKDGKAIDILQFEESGNDLALHIKKGLARKLYGTIAAHLTVISTIASILMFTPLARFYISENDWLELFLAILLFLTYVAICLKKDEYGINIFLLVILMLLQVSAGAVFVTFNDLLGVLQGILLTACGFSLLFFYSILFRKSCELRMALVSCLLVILTAAVAFQVIFGCTNEEFIVSVIFSLCLSLYYLYSVNLIIHSISHDKYCIALINVKVWPVVYLASKMNVCS